MNYENIQEIARMKHRDPSVDYCIYLPSAEFSKFVQGLLASHVLTFENGATEHHCNVIEIWEIHVRRKKEPEPDKD